MAALFRADGAILPFPLPCGPHNLLEVLRKAVDGDIEVIWLVDRRTMIVNADGLSLNLRHNEQATSIAAGSIAMDDWIKGNAVLCAPGELEAADSGEDDN